MNEKGRQGQKSDRVIIIVISTMSMSKQNEERRKKESMKEPFDL